MASRPERGAGVEQVDLSDRVAFVTGSTSGVGREAALSLGRLGATVYVHGRDRDAGRAVAAEIDAAGGESIFFRSDLSEQATVHDLAYEVRDRTDRLDILVNNAGTHFSEGELTSDGVERTFAINHLAPFILTYDLHDLLPPDGRVVSVSSEVHRRTDGRFNVTSLDDYDGLEAYARSKLANIYFTIGLASRLDGPTANCCHPGFVPASALWRDASVPIRAGVGLLSRMPAFLSGDFIDTPATAAETLVYLAVSPAVEGVSGRYFDDCAPKTPTTKATDERLVEHVWELSEDLTGISWP